MKRDARLTKLSWDHHHGLVMALRIERELPTASEDEVARLYTDLVAFWAAGLLPHFRVEQECLLARLVHHVSPEHEAVQRTHADHVSLESLVATMRDTRDPAVRSEALGNFGARLREHIHWEEAVLFELTQETLTGADMDALGDDISLQLPEVIPAPLAEQP